MLSQPKDRRIAAILAFTGAIPLSLPGFVTIAGLHKFYLGQPRWGIIYLLLCSTPIPAIASIIEGLWYLFQNAEDFNQTFHQTLLNETASLTVPSVTAAVSPVKAAEPVEVGTIADALRQLDRLRQDGLISEYEFEQKRRQLLDRMG